MNNRRPRAAAGPVFGLLVLLVALISGPLGPARALENLKVGVLKFGTVNWQLESLTHHGFDRAQGLEVTLLPLASKNATSVAFQAGEVDMIVSDWIWVLRQRAGAGEDQRRDGGDQRL